MFERRRHTPWTAAALAGCACALALALPAAATAAEASNHGGAAADDPKLKPPPPPKKAKLGRDGRVTPPSGAPRAVVRAIRAANRISRKPYVWGGGHRSFKLDSGYDCSGAMSYVLHRANPKLLDSPVVATHFIDWGRPGKGRWITTYANGGHSFMVIAGIRFDTGYHNQGRGPRWSTRKRPTASFVKRHPHGL